MKLITIIINLYFNTYLIIQEPNYRPPNFVSPDKVPGAAIHPNATEFQGTDSGPGLDLNQSQENDKVNGIKRSQSQKLDFGAMSPYLQVCLIYLYI